MKNNSKQTLRIYWEHARKYRGMLVVASVCSIIWAIGGMVLPIYYKQFFDLLTQSSNPSSQTLQALQHTMIIIIVLAFFFRMVIRRGADLANVSFRARALEDVANTCFAYVHKHSSMFFSNAFVGSLVKQTANFIRGFEIIIDRFFSFVIPLTIEAIMVVAVLGYRDWRLGLIAGVWLVVFLVVSGFMSRYRFPYIVKRSDAESKATGLLADTMTNHSNVKLFGGYESERTRYGAALALVRTLRIKTWHMAVTFDAVLGFLNVALEAGLLIGGFWLWRQGVLTAGDFVLMQSYLFRIVGRVWDFGGVVRDMYESLGDSEDMTQILITPHEIRDRRGAKSLVVTKGKIQMTDVTFNYHATRSILSNFNLTIAPHEKVALVGPSGAGKSTIVKLLLRMHDTTDGDILIDGQSIRKVTQASLWQAMSFVPQDPILFHRTLRENIRYGKMDATDSEVEAAARLAHCHEFIMETPEGYETYVGERGIKLSGGERQRVAIARAILRNAPILILDEATSSLDSESERLIQDALQNLMKGKTVMVIAHRLSTIMNMDRIVVVDRGQVTEQGTHIDLLQRKNGLYQRLWQIQAGGFL